MASAGRPGFGGLAALLGQAGGTSRSSGACRRQVAGSLEMPAASYAALIALSSAARSDGGGCCPKQDPDEGVQEQRPVGARLRAAVTGRDIQGVETPA